MRIKTPFVQRRTAVIVTQRINPTTLTTIMKMPFGFGALKLGVTPGGGFDGFIVAARKAARLAYDVVVDEVVIVDDIVGMVDDEIK